MSQPYLGQLILVGFNFAPVGYAPCDGRLLAIADYDALFNLIGTTYGGDGQTTFGLPDLRGRVAIGTGQGPALSNRSLGEADGTEAVTLGVAGMPAHTHTIDTSALMATAKCRNALANQPSPVGNVPGIEAAGVTATYSNAAPDANMHADAIAMAGAVTAANAGGIVPHDNMQPYLSLNYCIALEGIFPPQS